MEGDPNNVQVVVPIHGGARMTGKAGAFDVGALSIQTEESPEAGTASTNFTVLRIRRDILRRSSVGGIFTNRSVSLAGPRREPGVWCRRHVLLPTRTSTS